MQNNQEKSIAVKGGKAHWRRPSTPRSPTDVSITNRTLRKRPISMQKEMVVRAKRALDEKEKRILKTEAAMRTGFFASSRRGKCEASSSQPWPVTPDPRGTKNRKHDKFVGDELSPSLDPAVGGSGSKSSHAMILRDSPGAKAKAELFSAPRVD